MFDMLSQDGLIYKKVDDYYEFSNIFLDGQMAMIYKIVEMDFMKLNSLIVRQSKILSNVPMLI